MDEAAERSGRLVAFDSVTMETENRTGLHFNTVIVLIFYNIVITVYNVEASKAIVILLGHSSGQDVVF